MKLRSPAAPILLPLITFGIYALVWFVKTKNEMNASGARIPTAWLLLVPIASLVWIWTYSVAVEQFTHGGMSRVGSFWLLVLLGGIGCAVIQSSFNNMLLRMPSAGVPVALAA